MQNVKFIENWYVPNSIYLINGSNFNDAFYSSKMQNIKIVKQHSTNLIFGMSSVHVETYKINDLDC